LRDKREGTGTKRRRSLKKEQKEQESRSGVEDQLQPVHHTH